MGKAVASIPVVIGLLLAAWIGATVFGWIPVDAQIPLQSESMGRGLAALLLGSVALYVLALKSRARTFGKL